MLRLVVDLKCRPRRIERVVRWMARVWWLEFGRWQSRGRRRHARRTVRSPRFLLRRHILLTYYLLSRTTTTPCSNIPASLVVVSRCKQRGRSFVRLRRAVRYVSRAFCLIDEEVLIPFSCSERQSRSLINAGQQLSLLSALSSPTDPTRVREPRRASFTLQSRSTLENSRLLSLDVSGSV